MIYNKLIKHINAKKVFIGKSPTIQMTKFSGGIGKSFDGNTILLHIGEYKYAMIAEPIKIFTTNKDEITHYISPIGNNDVPYQFAIGKKYFYKLYDEGGYLDKKYLINKNLDGIVDLMFEYDPFFIPLNKINKKGMSIEEFETIRNTSLNNIPMNTIKELANMYHVTSSGTKKEVADRIKKVRNVVVYKK